MLRRRNDGVLSSTRSRTPSNAAVDVADRTESHDRKRNGSASSARTLVSVLLVGERPALREPDAPTSASARVSRARP